MTTDGRITRAYITLLLLSQYPPPTSRLTRMWWLHYLCTVLNLLHRDLCSCVQPRFNSTRNAELGGAKSRKHIWSVGYLFDYLISFPTNVIYTSRQRPKQRLRTHPNAAYLHYRERRWLVFDGGDSEARMRIINCVPYPQCPSLPYILLTLLVASYTYLNLETCSNRITLKMVAIFKIWRTASGHCSLHGDTHVSWS